MSTSNPNKRLSVQHFHPVDQATVVQTLAESEIEYSIDMGCFTVHHGMRYGAPIIIAAHHNQKPDQLSGIWYDDIDGISGAPAHV